MPQPRIISQLEQELGIEIKASKAESLQDFMRYGRREEDKAEYLLKEERLIGLKLRTLRLEEASFLQSDELANLQALYLVENDFSQLTLPESLQKLRYLNLADNKKLASFDFVGKMPFLQELDLSDSGLQSLHLPECPALKKLDVSRNQLTAFSFPSLARSFGGWI